MPRPNSSLARQWGNITMPHPGNALALHRVNPTPRQIHPRSASGPQRPNTVSGSTPVPHRAHNIPALPRGPSQEPRNKESVRIATFLRLAIAASSSIANRGTKTQQKWHISSLKEPRRAPNRKKVAKIPSFLFFCNGSDRCNRANPAKTRGASWPATQNQKQERRPPCGRLQKTKSAEIYASLAPYCS